MQRYLPTLIEHIDRLRADPVTVIRPEQTALLEELVEDLVEGASEKSDEHESESVVEGVTEEAITDLNEELIQTDTPDLIADTEVAEEVVAENT